MKTRTLFRFCPISSGVLAVALACGSVDSDSDKTKPDASLGGTSSTGGGGSSGLGGSAASFTGGAGGALLDAAIDRGDAAAPKETIRTCQGKTFQCGDTLDNDGDGLVDAADPDCVSVCGWSEKTAGPTGKVGDSCAQDCFYDPDPGSGNDQCHRAFYCDSHMVAPKFDPRPNKASCGPYDSTKKVAGIDATCSELKTKQPSGCASYCGPLTPNGCDCFGCCELPSGSNNWRYLGSTDKTEVFTCTSKDFNDPEKCRPCDPVPACLNKCDKCEVCLGGQKPGAGCGKAQQCPAGVPTCGAPGEPFCPKETYCVTGCCMPVPK